MKENNFTSSDKIKVLVTGGAGFIGSHLIESLINLGTYEVYSLDNYFTGRESNHVKGANYIKGSTCDIAEIISCIPSIVFHLGEYSRVEKSFDDMDQIYESNIDGTFKVIEFCRKNKCKLVYAGSSTRFGDDGLAKHKSPYAWTKYSNAELIKNYGEWFSLQYAIAYFYNVYGPREITEGPYATIVGIFKDCYKRGELLPVVSPGTQIRNFTHVKDIVKGLTLLGENGYGDNFGLGAEKQYSIIELAGLFDTEIKMLPERSGNRLSSTVDTTRSVNELGWSATYEIKDHIEGFIKQHEQ